jgi:hypothetical protein
MRVKKREVFDATEWFKQGDHFLVEKISKKYSDFLPVQDGAEGYIISEYTNSHNGFFVYPGDWIITQKIGNEEIVIDVLHNIAFNELFELSED